jgi:hypothetical protein
MRTGAEYRNALHDGRRIWLIGEGWVEDVTVHPATRAVVDEYVAWYDRRFDPEWQALVLTPPDARGERSPWGYVVPKSAADLSRMGTELLKDDLSQRRQPDAYPGLWPADRARCAVGRPGGQCLAKTDRRCGRLPFSRDRVSPSGLLARGGRISSVASVAIDRDCPGKALAAIF